MKHSVALLFLLLFTLSGCIHQTLTPVIDNAPHYQQQLAQLNHWQLEGKMAVRRSSYSETATMRWQQDDDHFDIFLSGPLGTGATQLVGTPKKLVIKNGGEQTTTTINPQQVIEKQLGWMLPLEQLPQWILGSTNSRNAEFNDDHTLAGFSQDEWQVNYASYQTVNQWLLPEKIILKHEDLQVTLVIKHWELKTTH